MEEQQTQRPGTLRFALIAAALLACLPLGWFFFLREAAPPPPAVAPAAPPAPAVAPPAAPEPAADGLRITAVEGMVEIRRGGGSFVPAEVGLALQTEDAIRTGSGKARLTSAGRYEVQVEPGTDLQVGELDARLSRFKLGLGMLVARVEGTAGTRLEVAAANSDATAATTSGTFAMSNNSAGTVAVGARDGEVEFRSAGKAVMLRGGQHSIASAGGAPSAPAPIPASLFLKVDWPKDREINKRRLTVSGKAVPGASLLVAGQPVSVGADGRFRATVKLREGRNVIRADCLDVAGHSAAGTTEVLVDTKAPDTDVKTQELWGR